MNPLQQIIAQFTKKPLFLVIAGVVTVVAAYAVISAGPVSGQINVMPSKNPNKGTLYLCMRMNFVGMGGMVYVPEFFYMLPDNRIYHRIPTGGLDTFDIEKAKANEPGDMGTYNISDGKMKVIWDDGNTREYKYEKKGGKILLDNAEMTKIDPFNKGVKLEGRWEYSMSNSADYGTGYKSSAFYSDSLTLHSDGTFEENGMSSVDSSSSENNIGGSSQGKNRGTYLIYDNTIVLTYPDSHTKQMTISAPYGVDKNYGQPAFLNIDGRMFYIRVKSQ